MENTALIILGQLLQRPDLYAAVNEKIDQLPKAQRDRFITRLVKAPSLDLQEMARSGNGHAPFINGRVIMDTIWPDPVWIVPTMIPAGLTFLAGAAKMGKSWLASQLAQAVATGGYFLGQKIDQGRICSLSLEDNETRLQNRMKKQGWSKEAQENIDYLLKRRFMLEIGDFRSGGADKLANYIEKMAFRLVIIDTLSRAIGGDQNDVAEMTSWIDPLQMVAQETNACILIIDHHKKRGGGGSEIDPIADVLGSTAKGAVADTIIGLYRERNKPGARLAITGRDVEERTLDIFADWQTGSWQLDQTGIGHLDPFSIRVMDALAEVGPASLTAVVSAVGLDKKNDTDVMKVKRVLLEMERSGKAQLVKTDEHRYPLWSAC